MCLDETLVRTDRAEARKPDGQHLYYSGRHEAFGVNVQVITDDNGNAIWVPLASPGPTHDLTAAREHLLPHLKRPGSAAVSL